MESGEYSKDWDKARDELLAAGRAAMAAGEVHREISCDEARREWFVVARSYVANNPTPRIPQDLELGLHLGACTTDECQALAAAYFDILRPSHPNAAELLSAMVDELERKIFPDEQQMP